MLIIIFLLFTHLKCSLKRYHIIFCIEITQLHLIKLFYFLTKLPSTVHAAAASNSSGTEAIQGDYPGSVVCQRYRQRTEKRVQLYSASRMARIT